MDITRKFIQMGRTRSLRYALRKGGRKYEHPSPDTDTKGKRKRTTTANDDDDEVSEGETHSGSRAASRKEIPRTGQVYDESKLEGANIFEGYLDRCWADEVYARAWEEWREAGKRKVGTGGNKGGEEELDTATDSTPKSKSKARSSTRRKD